MVCNIESLPGEVLAHIFSFLDWRGKLNVSSTCKHLMNATKYRPELFENVRIEVSQSLESGFEIFSTMSRNFCYFRFRGVHVNNKLCNFIEKFAPLFRRLHFEYSGLSVEDAEMIRGKIKNGNNLWELRMRESNAFMMFSHLPKLKSLYMYGAIQYSCLELAHIQNMAPATLADFSMRNTGMESGILYWFLNDFIRKRSQTLQSLDLKWNDMKSTDLVKLSRIEGLKLRRVILPGFSDVEENYDLPGLPELQSFISFCYNQRTIVDLDMTVDDAILATVFSTFPQMEGLTIKSQGEIDESLSMTFQMKRLQRLFINAFRITTDSFHKALDGFSCHNLKSLKLAYTIINDEVMSRLLPLVAANLRELRLYSCHEITDLTVFAISRWLTSLKVLKLQYLSNISNDGLLGHAKGSGTVPVPLSNIKGLELLSLKGCERQTEDGLIEAIRFEHLLKLDLHTKFTESGKMALIKGNPKLWIHLAS